MIEVKSNIKLVVDLTQEQLARVADTDKLLRTCATSVLFLIKDRVHGDGLDAAGSPIGVYSKPYMKTRVNRFSRTSSNKVVASLTRQMENDMRVVAIGKNKYGIGYSNQFNFQKSQWIEKRYKKPAGIFKVGEGERTAIITIVNKHVEDALPG